MRHNPGVRYWISLLTEKAKRCIALFLNNAAQVGYGSRIHAFHWMNNWCDDPRSMAGLS
ncbi:MAG TPA: hypothetical protein PKJ82_13070 [Saprospiraceae bacterium]|nr:hypothetical protein [Saprospiraceae bacterium]